MKPEAKTGFLIRYDCNGTCRLSDKDISYIVMSLLVEGYQAATLNSVIDSKTSTCITPSVTTGYLGFSSPIWTTMSWPFCSCTARLTCFIWKCAATDLRATSAADKPKLNDRLLGQSAHFWWELGVGLLHQSSVSQNEHCYWAAWGSTKSSTSSKSAWRILTELLPKSPHRWYHRGMSSQFGLSPGIGYFQVSFCHHSNAQETSEKSQGQFD